MTEPLLRAEQLRRQFGSAGVRQASLQLERGERVAIIGRSGSGKSTLLAMLAGLSRPDAGRIELRIDGPIDLWSLPTAERCRLRRGPLGFVSQFTSLLPSLTTLENLLLPGQLEGRRSEAELRADAEHWLEAVGLSHRRDGRPGLLSGGEMRRAILARALVNQPSLLLADEPTSNLDGASESEIVALLESLCASRGTALLMVTHSEALARRCDRWLELEDGLLREPSAQAEAVPPLPWRRNEASLEEPADPARRRFLTAALVGGLSLVGSAAIRQRHRQLQRGATTRRDLLQRLAFSGLSAELVAVEMAVSGTYQGTITIENLDGEQPLYLLPLDVQLFIQQGARWNPFPAHWRESDRQVITVEGPRPLRFEFAETPSQYSELLPGYLHVRIDVTYAIANRPDPDQEPVERRDSFFIYLLPPSPDAEKVARNGFPGEAPRFIPMPPH